MVIKMADTLAKRLLMKSDCNVIVNGEEKVTKAGTINFNGEVQLTNGEYVKLTDIERIEYTDRFGNTNYWEVGWNG